MENEHPRPEKDTIFYYLKDWLYSLSPDDILLFLGWVTCADVLPFLPITVMFHQGAGLSCHASSRQDMRQCPGVAVYLRENPWIQTGNAHGYPRCWIVPNAYGYVK